MPTIETFPTVLAEGVVPQFLTEIVALIVAGALIAYICFRLRLVPIVGFLLAGVMIGPNAFGLVRDQALGGEQVGLGLRSAGRLPGTRGSHRRDGRQPEN